MGNVRLMLSAALVAGTAASLASASDTDYTSEVGLIALNATEANSVTISGSGQLRVPRLMVNSNDPEAVSGNGNGTFRTRIMQVNGGTSFSGSVTVTGLILENAGALANPFEDLEMPDPDSYPPDQGRLRLQGGNHTVSPGYYSDGIEIRSNATVQFLPGEYIIDGLGLKALSGDISGEGVVFLNISGRFDLSGNAKVNLTAPTEGYYKGLVLVQDPGCNNWIDLRGGGDFNIQGTICATGAHAVITGNGGVTGSEPFFADLMVVDTVEIGGNGSLRVGEWYVAGQLPIAALYD